MTDLKRIEEYDPKDQLNVLMVVCNKIYIARNITLSEDGVKEGLKMIDKLFRDENTN